jgi:hypothetical protein
MTSYDSGLSVNFVEVYSGIGLTTFFCGSLNRQRLQNIEKE